MFWSTVSNAALTSSRTSSEMLPISDSINRLFVILTVWEGCFLFKHDNTFVYKASTTKKLLTESGATTRSIVGHSLLPPMSQNVLA